MRRGVFGLFGRRVDHDRRFVDGRNQFAQLFNGEVERIGNGAGDVFGDGRFNRQVAVGQAAHFVEQAQNRLLVAIILIRLLLRHRSKDELLECRAIDTRMNNSASRSGLSVSR